MLKIYTIVVLSVAVYPTSFVAAADLIPPPESSPQLPQPRPTPAWEGSYAGLAFGLGQLQGIFTDDCRCETSADTHNRHLGLFFGHNWQVADRSWIGLESDVGYDWRDIDVYGAHVGTDLSGSVRLRLGEEVGNALVYAAAGWTAANAYVENPDDSAVAHGWTLGFGVDWSMDDSTFLRAEYRYNDYAPVDLAGVEVEFERDVVSVGIAHRF